MNLNESTVLLEVLKFLDCKTLKTAALVCGDWNRLIGSSPKLMKKFKLNLDWYKPCELSAKVERKHVNVFIQCSEKTLEMLEQCDVTEVRVFEIKANFALLMRILRRMPFLEVLTIDVNKYEHFDIAEVPMLALKRLTIQSRDFGILDFIDLKKLEVLEVEFVPDYYKGLPRGTEALLSILRNAEALKSLTVNKWIFERFFQQQTNFPFHLTALNVKHWNHDENLILKTGGNFPEVIKHFVLENCHSLTQFNGGLFREFPMENLVAISKMKSLTDLTLKIHDLPRLKKQFNDIKPLKALKNLKLSGYKFSTDAAASEISRLCPNITSLTLCMDIYHEISYVSNYNRNLKELEIKCFKLSRPATNLRSFNFLEKLTVRSYENVRNLAMVLKFCPQLQTLTIKQMDNDSEVDLLANAVVEHPSLKHVSVFGKEWQMRKMFEKISSNYGNLKSLKLHTTDKMFVEGYTKQMLKFQFPENPCDWNQFQWDEL